MRIDIDRLTEAELIDLNRWTEWGLPLIGRFELVEEPWPEG